MPNMQSYFILLIGFTLFLVLAIWSVRPISRYVIKLVTNSFVSKLLTEEYTKNIAELLPSITRLSALNLLELSLRAETGKVITRPLGSPRHFAGYDMLMFSPRQMSRLSLPENTPLDMSVTIGPKAEKPLVIQIPLMIAAMAYGLALSEEAKIALARAAKKLQTATCSGEGPYLPEEPLETDKYILQICRWSWGARTAEQIAMADMLEVQMGQGADMGTATIEAAEIEGRARILGGLKPGEPAVQLPSPPGLQSPAGWPAFMQNLRKRAKGVPIALKIMATDRLEEELDMAIQLGFDAVMIDGAEGGSHATAPIKQDDFGIPSLTALARAKRHLKGHPISLVVSGGYFTPGQCLKALALGADAIYLATVPLLALGHGQIQKVIPWEPPTTLIYYNSPTKTELDIDLAATNVANVLTSMVQEMEEGMRALGKASLRELSPDDLVALDALTADLTGVRLANKTAPPSSQVKNTVPESLDTYVQTLALARQLEQLSQSLLTELRKGPDLNRIRQFNKECDALLQAKQALDGLSRKPAS